MADGDSGGKGMAPTHPLLVAGISSVGQPTLASRLACAFAFVTLSGALVSSHFSLQLGKAELHGDLHERWLFGPKGTRFGVHTGQGLHATGSPEEGRLARECWTKRLGVHKWC